jgi:hypothetical protein
LVVSQRVDVPLSHNTIHKLSVPLKFVVAVYVKHNKSNMLFTVTLLTVPFTGLHNTEAACKSLTSASVYGIHTVIGQSSQVVTVVSGINGGSLTGTTVMVTQAVSNKNGAGVPLSVIR